MKDIWVVLSLLIVLGVLLAAYFIPTLIAIQRKHRYRESIFLLNLLLGWTFVGWVAALVWATMAPYLPPPLKTMAPPLPNPRKTIDGPPFEFCFFLLSLPVRIVVWIVAYSIRAFAALKGSTSEPQKSTVHTRLEREKKAKAAEFISRLPH